ncbi:MAG: hypothetical protein K6F71_11485 [Ruminococcus sp.]|uniref:hypothetical protein n=1 Tax=Ruminococcus sp. TaxID=41978 RepID=UPI0025EFC06B|nr:hypothetical protein [Ruminococcus sp.]MCR5541420.1 hypothetical protein [Ruminococcus sp.]
MEITDMKNSDGSGDINNIPDKEKYLKKLKIWRIIFYISLPLAVVSGVLSGLVYRNYVRLPMNYFIAIATPFLNFLKPIVPKDLESSLSEKEKPISTGAYLAIFFVLCIASFVVTVFIAK